MTGFSTIREALRHWRSMRLASVVLLSGLLAGCWMSDEPLIGRKDAAVVPFAGPFRPAKDDVTIEVTANPDGSYSLTDNDGMGFTAYFMEVQDGWYVTQQKLKDIASQDRAGQSGKEPAKSDKGSDEPAMHATEAPLPAMREGPYLYNLVHLRGKDLVFHVPECDEATRALPGVALDKEAQAFGNFCEFATAQALREAAPGTIARIEAGKIADEPSVLQSLAPGGE